MTSLRTRLAAILAALAAVSSACKVSESGNSPCGADSNCPKDYPQCIRVGSAASKCTEAVTGTPQLGTGAITVTPGSMSGGAHPAIALALPALAGNANLGRKVTLAIASGGAPESVVKTGGAAVTLDDLGTSI